MASQTSIVAKQVRLMEWAEQIRDCQNRPKEWMWHPGAPSMALRKLIFIGRCFRLIESREGAILKK